MKLHILKLLVKIILEIPYRHFAFVLIRLFEINFHLRQICCQFMVGDWNSFWSRILANLTNCASTMIWNERYGNLSPNLSIFRPHCCRYWMILVQSDFFSHERCCWSICFDDIQTISAGFCKWASVDYFCGYCSNCCSIPIAVTRRNAWQVTQNILLMFRCWLFVVIKHTWWSFVWNRFILNELRVSIYHIKVYIVDSYIPH